MVTKLEALALYNAERKRCNPECEFKTGSTTAIAAAGTAVAQNTKINKMHVDEITSATTKVRITRDAGNFTDAAGVIRAIVYYETFTAMGAAV